LSIENIKILDEVNVDLVSNFVSFGEMRRNFFNTYINSKFFKNSKQLYVVNRFVSSPFFEKTYDSDLTIFDYQFENFLIEYCDIFPIHHYDQHKRFVLNRLQHINSSSSQFEAYYTKKII
jgi:hypothetical protein